MAACHAHSALARARGDVRHVTCCSWLGVLTTGSAAALGWLAWEMLRQDEVVADRQQLAQLEYHADRVVQTLERRLTDADAQLAEWVDAPASPIRVVPEGGVAVQFAKDSVTAVVPARLLFHPIVPPRAEPTAAIFAAGEAGSEGPRCRDSQLSRRANRDGWLSSTTLESRQPVAAALFN